MTFVAMRVKLEAPGPVLYSSQMIGEKGKVFSLFRFRTMTSVPDANGETRLTRIGSLIRNYSLDHLPMLINVFKGDLTIVGPRPMETQVVDLADPTWRQYFQAKPGLFNYAVLKLGKLWTPSRVSDPTLNQQLELEYRKKRSASLDFQVFTQFLASCIASKGNVKARGMPDQEAASKMKTPHQTP